MYFYGCTVRYYGSSPIPSVGRECRRIVIMLQMRVDLMELRVGVLDVV
jgi:hypothetical protein